MSRQLSKGVYFSSSLLLSWASVVPCGLVHTLVLLCALCPLTGTAAASTQLVGQRGHQTFEEHTASTPCR